INGADSLPVRPHECHLVKKRVLDANGKPTNTFEDDKLMLYVASWGWSHLESNRDGKALGGVIAFEIEGYKNNPTNVSVTQSQYWGYDNDRVYATSNKLSALLSGAYNSKWLRRSTHTVQSVHIDLDNQFFLTADEFGSPFMSLLDSTIGQVNYLSRFKADSTEKTYHYSEWKNLWGYSQTGSAPAEYYNDDRKIGNYIKIWGSDSTQCWVKGLGTNDSTSEIGGPLGSYDTPDILPDDYKKNGKNASLTNSEIRNNSDEFIGGNPNPYFLDATNTSTPQVGPNTCHHLNTVYGITGHLPNDAGLTGDEKYKIRREVYTSNYSQGARVIDLKDFIKGSFSYYDTAKIVRERAYFDCLPTLTYDQSDRYFYMIKDVGRRHIDDCLNKNELNNYFKDQISEYPNYFLGIWDVLPDVADSIYRPELQSDESFVYALGQNAKQGPWLQKGGFLILRYFRDEIGGLITGYASPSGSNVLPFREVNLQGEFKVQRDVTIDTGTTVNILPGRNNDPGIFEKTAFNVGTNGMKRIIVKGTLNVSMPEGDNQQGTSIVFNVPIVVERGGKLVIYKIRNSKTEPVVFNEYVDVDSGGILQINKNAYVAFYTRVFIKGKIDVLGEQDSLATIVGGLDKTKKLPHFTYLHPYEGQAQIYVDGEDVTSIYENRIKLRYGEFRSIPIIVKNAFGFTPVAYRCKFLDSTRYNSQGFPIDYFMDSSMNKPYLYFWYCEGNNNDSKRRIRIIDCIFSDSSEINSVPHFVEQRTLRIGLKITDYKSVYIENCSFYQLKLGAFIKNTPIGQILESNFSYCNMGVHNNASIVHECQDTFRKCIIGSFSNYAYTSNFFDNTFDTVQTGVAIFNSADQFFKGNAFDYYSHGISVLSSTAHLTIYQKPNLLCPNSTPYYIYLGRNVFSYPQFRDTVTEFEMIPESNDINLMDDPADVKLKCGYNDFAENSSYHLSKNPWGYRIVDGSYNKFNPDSTPSHNEYVSINGEHFNESQTANLGCDESLVCADNCQTTPLVINRIEINEDTPLPAIVNLFDTSRFQMNNFSLPPNSRIEYARQTLETGAIIDSVNTLLPDLINDYNSIIADTNFTNSERINARFLKGQIYERLYKIDSAIIVYNDIYNHNITYADSLILKWKLLELNPFIIDTTLGHIFDSLIYIYHKTVADDLLLHSGDGGGQQKQSIQIETNPKDETILVNKIDYVNPNPVTNNSEIQYNINDDCDVAIDVINESGQLIKSLARGFHKAGTYNVRLDAHDMNSGVYLVTMKACDQNSIMKFQVLK
ncbi:MAG: Por secretion system C-terminal sorting protein, partial [Ignavibacteria bacterium]|nr:Por secretion system C-terminal sorting protein [Ignavibacteria bacterium]